MSRNRAHCVEPGWWCQVNYVHSLWRKFTVANYTRKWLGRGASTGIAWQRVRRVKAKDKAQSCDCVANEKDSTALHKAWTLPAFTEVRRGFNVFCWLRWRPLEVMVPHAPEASPEWDHHENVLCRNTNTVYTDWPCWKVDIWDTNVTRLTLCSRFMMPHGSSKTTIYGSQLHGPLYFSILPLGIRNMYAPSRLYAPDSTHNWQMVVWVKKMFTHFVSIFLTLSPLQKLHTISRKIIMKHFKAKPFLLCACS